MRAKIKGRPLPKIAVVEPSPLLESQVQECGMRPSRRWRTVGFRSVNTALNELATNPVKAVLVDERAAGDTSAMRLLCSRFPVLLASSYQEPGTVVTAFLRGVCGILWKPFSDAVLAGRLAAVLSGCPPLCHQTVRLLVTAWRRAAVADALASLSIRELEVIMVMAGDHFVTVSGDALAIHGPTRKTHRPAHQRGPAPHCLAPQPRPDSERRRFDPQILLQTRICEPSAENAHYEWVATENARGDACPPNQTHNFHLDSASGSPGAGSRWIHPRHSPL